MVDAAFGKTVRIEVVESSVERISVVALLVRIAEDAFADKCVVGLVGLVDVEVSRQDSRQILASSQFFHLFLYEESALHTGFLADVVHVEIEEQKLETGIFAFEVTPAANTRQYGIPAFARHVRSFRQPEISFLYDVEFVGAVEDSGVFAFVFTVVAPYTDIVIAGKGFFHVFQLVKEAFLCAENIEIVILHDLGNHRITLSPSVSTGGVGTVGISQVVGGNGERSRLIALAVAEDYRCKNDK